MPIIHTEDLSLEKHVFPILQEHGKQPRWVSGGDDGGDHEGIRCIGGYVSVCNSNHLYVKGTEAFAEFLLDHICPFGKEITIHLYPEDPTIANNPPAETSFWQNLLMYVTARDLE